MTLMMVNHNILQHLRLKKASICSFYKNRKNPPEIDSEIGDCPSYISSLTAKTLLHTLKPVNCYEILKIISLLVAWIHYLHGY